MKVTFIKIKITCKRRITKEEGLNCSNASSKQIDTLDKITLLLLKIVLIIDFLSLILIPHLKELFL